MSIKSRIVILVGVVAAAIGVGVWWVGPSADRTESASPEKSPRVTAGIVRPPFGAHAPSTSVRPAKQQKRPPTVRPPKPVLDLEEDDDDDHRTPAERALAARIEKALDDEKLEDALACAKEALVCTNGEIRQAMVDTLGWFGAKALPELTPFMADPDEDIRESAQNEWTAALSEIEEEAEKIPAVEMAMQALTDEDVLEDISNEYIGVDEKLAVESLLRILEGTGCDQGKAKARETYEFVTGEEFTDRAAAEKWLAEEYQP